MVILGAGESGVGAALLAKHHGYSVFVSDNGSIADRFKSELEAANIAYESNGHSMERLMEADVLIKSPGIPDHIELIQNLKAAGIDPISEIEFAYGFCTGKIVAITGSNGKTTTTALCGHLFEGSSLSVRIGGNYGISFARLLTKELVDVYVLELSSFQLDGIRNFKPDVAILLNITEDHLDRYEYDLKLYAASKFRVSMHQGQDDVLILNGEDSWCQRLMEQLADQQQSPKIRPVLPSVTRTTIYTKPGSKEPALIKNKTLLSTHNSFNAQCAIYAALELGVSVQHIEGQLDSFVGLEHRMEFVASYAGVDFINDSKATNVDAVLKALDSLEAPVVWIAGGVDKGNDYRLLQQFVNTKVEALICLGVDNAALRAAFSADLPKLIETKEINQAVQEAFRLAEGRGTVLLSPACASFDLFKNYIDRGHQFKRAVHDLMVSK